MTLFFYSCNALAIFLVLVHPFFFIPLFFHFTPILVIILVCIYLLTHHIFLCLELMLKGSVQIKIIACHGEVLINLGHLDNLPSLFCLAVYYKILLLLTAPFYNFSELMCPALRAIGLNILHTVLQANVQVTYCNIFDGSSIFL